MKTIINFLLLLMVFFTFSSCEKDDLRPNYYYKFKVNGVQKEFKGNKDANIVFIEDSNSINRFTVFTFVTGDDPTKNAIVISLRTTVTPGFGIKYEMQNPIPINNQVVPMLAFIYLDENGKEYSATLLQSQHPGAMDNGSLMLTELTAVGSLGVFEAIVFDVNQTGELSQRQPLNITDGEFFMPNLVSLR